MEGGRRAADELPRMWPPSLDRGGGVSPVRPPDALRSSGTGWSEVLRVFGGGHHTLPELRGAQLRSAPPEHLRLARQGRGLRAAVRELLLLGCDLEDRWRDYLRNRSDYLRHLFLRILVTGLEQDGRWQLSVTDSCTDHAAQLNGLESQ